jgi:hypothetical protein
MRGQTRAASNVHQSACRKSGRGTRRGVSNRCKSVSNRCKNVCRCCNSAGNDCNGSKTAVESLVRGCKKASKAAKPLLIAATTVKNASKAAQRAAIKPRSFAKDAKSSAIALLGVCAGFRAADARCYTVGAGVGAGAGSSFPGQRPRSLMVRASWYLATKVAPAGVRRRGRMRSSISWSWSSKATKAGRSCLVVAALPPMASSGAAIRAA